ncbi:MAG: sodium-dependent bicarbonate transport family permease [Opitutales bacterium]
MTWVNIFNLPVLFFVFGVFAKLIRSNLEIPEPIVKAVTLYLMMAIGVKGGLSLVEAPSLTDAAAPIIIVILASFIVPTYVYYSLKRVVGEADAASIGATYGSNSTMTFVTAAAFLNTMDVPYGGYMTVALVVMETPAIIYSIFLYNRSGMATTWVAVRDALIDGTQLLLIGSLVIGLLGSYVTQDTDMLTGFISGDIFTGMIGFFLLYMGLKVGENLRDNLKQLLTPFLGLFACLAPWLNGAIGFALAWAFDLDAGDGLLVTILCASSSYIVAPAIIPYAIPQANIGRFLTMSIGITFPVNILIGIPVWWALCEQVLM